MKYCGNCGKELNDEDKFCSYCATEFIVCNPEAELNISRKENKKKPIKKIVLFVIIALVAVMGIYLAFNWSDFVSGYRSVAESDTQVSENISDNESDDSNLPSQETVEEDITEKPTEEQKQTIDVFDLFESLEKAESLLGSETQPSKDVQAYTNHFFGNVKIQCVYNSSEVYSITVDYNDENSLNDLKVNGLDENSVRSDWDKAFGDLFYNDYDSDGNMLYGYELEKNGHLYYIEFTVSTEKTEKIGVYLEE